MPIRRGTKTTEAWASGVIVIVGILASLGVMSENDMAQIVGLVITMVGGTAYAGFRSVVKVAELKSNATTQINVASDIPRTQLGEEITTLSASELILMLTRLSAIEALDSAVHGETRFMDPEILGHNKIMLIVELERRLQDSSLLDDESQRAR